MTETTRPAATSAQRIVAAMWTLDHPATAKQIATAAEVGYSTVSPVLRTLLANGQAVRSEGNDGSTLWRLETDSALAAANNDPASPAGTPQHPANAESDDRHSDASPAGTNSRHDVAAEHATSNDVAESGSDAEDHLRPEHTDPTGSEPQLDAPAEPHPAGPDTDTDTADTSDADTSSATRPYRKPVKPRRPAGALRASIRAVLAGEPDRAFRVGEVCKVIDGADPDATFNKAGPGAVANALDKLTTDGDADRVSERPPSYRFRANAVTPDSPQ